MFTRLHQRWKLRGYIKQGLQIADDCRLVSLPNFGSEPYLISIGKHVTIASGVSFIAHDGGTWVFRDQPKYREVIRYGRIVIHDNCFIGYGAILMPGVSVGPNAVVASGAVVTRDVPPDTVAGGVPARPLMSIETYAEKCLAAMPDYDHAAYKQNKVSELLRLFPRPW
ncbi:MAG TPA: acyltransferase [Holophagaceae bacterium]|jgi:acetyltransferase-like isoleucine patch superfamily enzyme|nr:acyltransferase [Holophagaceae bacterium]